MRYIFITVLAFLPTAYTLAISGPLVPCDGPECGACDLVALGQNILEFLITLLVGLGTLMFAWAGILMATSAGNASQVEKAKGIFANVLIGMFITLSAYLVIDTVMKVLFNQGKIGPWNQIQCVVQPQPQRRARTTASGFNKTLFSSIDAEGRVKFINASSDVVGMAKDAAAKAGITDPNEVNTFVALVSQESSLCKNKVGPATSYGTAYGCGQMLLSTARGLDSKVTVARLRDDDAYNLSLSATYFKQQKDRYKGDLSLTLASYNGGDKANSRSSVCPGQLAWQCSKNSGYAQTRNYVSNIRRVAADLNK